MPKKYSIDVVLIIANFYLSEKELLVSMLDKSDDLLPFPLHLMLSLFAFILLRTLRAIAPKGYYRRC